MAKKPTNRRRRKLLAARVTRDGVLTIEIGIDALKLAAEYGQYRADGGNDTSGRAKVIDAHGFARTVAKELMDEVAEDGSTPLTLALDRAIESATESDLDSIRLESDTW